MGSYVEVIQNWFAHIERQKAKAKKLSSLAVLARTDAVSARRELAQIDKQPTVFDGSTLEPAVKECLAVNARLRAQNEKLRAAVEAWVAYVAMEGDARGAGIYDIAARLTAEARKEDTK
jgi:hypothetical protein